MDGNQLDDLVRRFHRGEIGRRQLVIGWLAIAVGATGATRLALAQEVDPTPTAPAIQGQTGDTRQQFPCPEPSDPFDWICGTGPFAPWYPVIAPPEVMAATDIQWYGVQGLETGGLRAAVFDRADREVSHYESARADGGLRWSFADATTSLDGFFNPPRVDGSLVEIGGEINGAPFRSVVGEDGTADPDSDQPIELSASQELLLSHWQPAAERGDALLELALTSGQDPLEASDSGCFFAGYVAAAFLPLCFALPGAGCLPSGASAAYIANNCTDSW